MERVNFNHLFYFYITAKEGSIKRAAEVLNVTQPTISDQIKLLEEYFRTSLFLRKSRSLQLTKQGELALEYADTCFRMGQELTGKLRNPSEKSKTSLDVGVVHSLSHFHIYQSLLKVFERNELNLKVREGELPYLLTDLEEGVVDVVFTDRHNALPNHLTAYKLGTNRTFAVADRSLCSRKWRFPEVLNEVAFFHYTSDSILRYEIDLYFRRHGLNPKVIGEGDDIDLLQMVTDNKIAFTIVPEIAANRFLQNKNLKLLGELKELQTSFWGIIRSKETGLAKEILEVIDEE